MCPVCLEIAQEVMLCPPDEGDTMEKYLCPKCQNCSFDEDWDWEILPDETGLIGFGGDEYGTV